MGAEGSCGGHGSHGPMGVGGGLGSLTSKAEALELWSGRETALSSASHVPEAASAVQASLSFPR